MNVALTGGAKGVGAEIARKLDVQGHSVTAFDILEPTELVEWIKGQDIVIDGGMGAMAMTDALALHPSNAQSRIVWR